MVFWSIKKKPVGAGGGEKRWGTYSEQLVQSNKLIPPRLGPGDFALLGRRAEDALLSLDVRRFLGVRDVVPSDNC